MRENGATVSTSQRWCRAASTCTPTSRLLPTCAESRGEARCHQRAGAGGLGGSPGQVIGLSRRAAGGVAGHQGAAGDGEHGRYDPHAWQDVANVRTYVANIRDALKGVDSANAATYETRAADYLQRLDALQTEIEAAYRDVPKPRRVVTSHDAFRYYGDAYGIAFLAPQGVTEAAQPSAAKVAQLIRQIRRDNIKAVFVETISTPRVIEQIARETGGAAAARSIRTRCRPKAGRRRPIST